MYNRLCEGGYAMAVMGRPRVDEPKDKRVSMRVNEKDYNEIMAYAKDHNLTVAELIKEAVNQYMDEKNKLEDRTNR